MRIRGPPKEYMEKVYIIRFTDAIHFKDGVFSNMMCASGTQEEVEEYAERVAKENGTSVAIVV